MRHASLAPLLSTLVLLVSALVAHRPAPAPSGRFCYLHGDASHALTWANLDDFDPRTNEFTVGRARTRKVDALTVDPRTGVAYGVDSHLRDFAGYLGTFNLATGAFERLGGPIGTGQGAIGPVYFHDISGLAFDPATGWLYAVQIRTGIGRPDALLRVDPATGRFVPGAFGGADYAPLRPLHAYPHLWDVDDIAFDPADGQLYGIVNNSADGDRLVGIDKATGALRDVGPFGVGEVEGLSFDAHGQLWATAGGEDGTPANKLYQVDKATGAASDPRPLNNSSNYEALACLTAAPDLALELSAGRAPAQPGDPLLYTLRYANLGSGPAPGTTLTLTVPAYAAFDAAASSPGWRPAPGRAGVYVLDLGTLEPGQPGQARLAVIFASADRARASLASAAISGAAAAGLDLRPADNYAALVTRR